jgi:hypothetical protein
MKVGYRCVHSMQDELAAFMDRHSFATLDDFKGHSLQFFTTHYDLVRRQGEARQAAKAQRDARAAKEPGVVRSDHQWTGESFVEQSDALARG